MRHLDPQQSPPGEIAALLQPLVDRIDMTIKAQLKQAHFQRDPRAVRLVLPLLRVINRYFGAEIRGWQNLPKHGAFLIVGNHSGGAQTTDVAALLERWIEDRGPKAALYMLGYDLTFAYPIVGPWFRKLGLLRANPAIAKAALKRGAATVVFPGGDHEVFRPWSERNKIDFGGHMGFVELALTARVPVVPMTIHGAHQSTFVLTRGRRIARWMGLERLHIKVFPFIWHIPLGVAPAFVPSVQLPAKVTVQFGEPLDWSRYGPGQAKNPRVVRKCYAEITGVMQKTLDALAQERPYPVLTRLNELRPSQMVRRLLPGENGAIGSEASGQPHETKHVLGKQAPERLRAGVQSRSRRGYAVRGRPVSAA
ncbi:MAG TPA: 1-acyl-sn-glycerol-3-phosphate acyltransferase [Candidatus Margulisiibacteriota bacterium]|nr:1-acyl-sn-glycerol-3-phosphate acyltransferase [Candidatus Margulisiibacteriota bacterium]